MAHRLNLTILIFLGTNILQPEVQHIIQAELLAQRCCAQEAESCPERAGPSERGRGCLKACLQDQDCPIRRKCLCDGECGWSCVSPARSCPWPLSSPQSVSLLLSPSPSFSALIEVSCQEGFMMADGRQVVIRRCQGDRHWSGEEPFCVSVSEPTETPLTCPAPGQIENGFNSGGRFTVGATINYTCNPGFELLGVSENYCQENQTWKHPEPTCRLVLCSPPLELSHGYLVAVQRKQYEAGEVIYYLCRKGFLLDGSNRVVCQSNGTWSPTPFCRARCAIPAQRSRVLYNGKKLWPYEVQGGQVQHGEGVSFYCRDEARRCSYTIQSECFDGTLPLPPCYDEPTWLQYKLFTNRVVSEIKHCDEGNQ
ncbi:complement receptor type 2 isoform X1 [Acipenser ruthenus]|uniref:complement receptor type 2 isoform X1 n=1 Tax=Acipenser ruthenus TaxID=7906 RepID=UPI002742043D|nr:complement receptor type 2 isoform X1 [Acipenser ruthenus]